MNTLSDTSEYLLPAGAELLYETSETIEHVGSVACVASLQSGKIDDVITSGSSDPTATPYADFKLSEVIDLN